VAQTKDLGAPGDEMRIERLQGLINGIINENGWFVNWYWEEKQIGTVAHIAITAGELGNGLIIGESSRNEFYQTWTKHLGRTPPEPPPNAHFYRVMVD